MRIRTRSLSFSMLALLVVGCAGAEGADSSNDLSASGTPSGSTPSSVSDGATEPDGSRPGTPSSVSPPAPSTSGPATQPDPSRAEPEPSPGSEPEMPHGVGGTATEPEPDGVAGRSEPVQSSAGGAGPLGGGGNVATAGAPSTAGSGGGPRENTGGRGAEEDPTLVEAIDCGPNAFVIESAGPPANRVNYVIAGDGYTAEELETTYLEHIAYAMEKRFREPIGQPYIRYRKFVNICAVKVVSQGGICGNSALGCCGDDQSRLANCNRNAAFSAMEDALAGVPDFDIDWTAVVLNGDSWWNTGSDLMLWSGGNRDAHGAALHEGGHGFHQLADEYDGTDGNCSMEFWEVNSTADPSDSNEKWGAWLGFEQRPGTGMQDFFEGSRYCQSQQYRPSDNSMMNMLFGDDEDTSFNAVSREKMIFDFWRFVRPVDSLDPPEGDVSGTTVLRVNVIDPEVIDVNWSVDGVLVEEDGGAEFDVAVMGPGTYEVTALAFDNAGEDLVRHRDGGEYGRENWERSKQELHWTVSVP